MLRSLNDLLHYTSYTVCTHDGDVGRAHDILFDDDAWMVRYFVVDTGSWLPGRRVLIAPAAVEKADAFTRRLHLSISREQVESSPDVDADLPVSRRMEALLAAHYDWPVYWGPQDPAGVSVETDAAAVESASEAREEAAGTAGPDTSSTLHRLKEITGYHIRATDGAIGHVEEFIAEDATWKMRYLVVDTRNWLPGRKVLLALPWVHGIDETACEVRVEMGCDEIKGGPEYDPEMPVNRDYEEKLHDYYGRPKYWHD